MNVLGINFVFQVSCKTKMAALIPLILIDSDFFLTSTQQPLKRNLASSLQQLIGVRQNLTDIDRYQELNVPYQGFVSG